jgi:hypothetical protein
VPLYVGLAKSGIIRSPFFPRAEGDLALAKSDRAGLRVLFVGNSFTWREGRAVPAADRRRRRRRIWGDRLPLLGLVEADRLRALPEDCVPELSEALAA